MAKDVYLPDREDGLSLKRRYTEAGAHWDGGFYPGVGLYRASQHTVREGKRLLKPRLLRVILSWSCATELADFMNFFPSLIFHLVS